MRKVNQNTNGAKTENILTILTEVLQPQVVSFVFCDDWPDDAECEVVGGGWSQYCSDRLCLTKSYLLPG